MMVAFRSTKVRPFAERKATNGPAIYSLQWPPSRRPFFVMDERVNPFLERRVAFVGKLGGMTLHQAQTLVRRLGGTPVAADDPRIDLVVVGADQLVGQASSPATSSTPRITE